MGKREQLWRQLPATLFEVSRKVKQNCNKVQNTLFLSLSIDGHEREAKVTQAVLKGLSLIFVSVILSNGGDRYASNIFLVVDIVAV